MKKEQNIFCKFLRKNNILCGLKESDGKAVLRKLISTLQQHSPGLDIDFVRKEVESREALFPTMIAPGFAIPHARIPGLSEPLTAIGCIPEGCEFGGTTKAKVMILLLTLPIRTGLHYSPLTFVIMFLNGMVFATIALVLSFLAKSYTDAPRFTSYIIMPMSFLCNTFFSTEQMPNGFRQIISLLPLSQASSMIRAIANAEPVGFFGFGVLAAYLVVFGAISVWFIYRKKNL